MKNYDIWEFITSGEINSQDYLGCSRNDLVELLGDPEYVEDYGKAGEYYFYNSESLKFTLYESEVTDVGFYFGEFKPSVRYKFKNLGFISRETLLYEFIKFLQNFNDLEWEINKKLSNKDYLVIEIRGKTQIYFNLQDGTVNRIKYPLVNV